jgi:glycine dehydrogenase
MTHATLSRPDNSAHNAILDPSDTFARRHIGPDPAATREMLELLGYDTLDALADATVPSVIRSTHPLNIPAPKAERELLEDLQRIANKNKIMRSCIGQGYTDTITPAVIQRNILENPGWYTQYTPYQAEISQGRLEALLNFQTMIADLTGLPLANASLLDEATAAAEAMLMARALVDQKRNMFLVSGDCHPQTIAVVRGRAKMLGIEVIVAAPSQFDIRQTTFGILLQYPATDGRIEDYTALSKSAHAAGALVVVAADILALTLLRPPGAFGADICVGSTQRFGMPMGCGGPHAAFMSTKTEYARKMPGRLVGVSKDASGNRALRLAIQTREQHIRREKATSNICTAQVLPAIVASMYAVYHGPDGLKRIAQRVHAYTIALANGLRKLGHDTGNDPFFDTLRIRPNDLPAESILSAAESRGYNLRNYADGTLGITLDETTTRQDVQILIESFAGGSTFRVNIDELSSFSSQSPITNHHERSSLFLTHSVFHLYHAEHEMLRYIKRLESRDLSLTTSMIPLGSCTMKLNATTEMMPITWPAFARIHPFAPTDQLQGYTELCTTLETWLADITGFAAVSLQPNAGSQGEYAGLLTIRAYHEANSKIQNSEFNLQNSVRNICLIPTSAHGTNPASAVVAGLKVIPVACDETGNIDLTDLRAKASAHKDNLAALMITYPSTHGVFEPRVKEVCQIAHEFGAQVYMDGANMNAQVGLTSPGEIGADVCHLNLHKTFCIPHGGGGPGMGPIAVAAHLKDFLPASPIEITGTGTVISSSLISGQISREKCGESKENNRDGDGCFSPPVSAAPYGSALILTIPYAYIAMMGATGLTRATQSAILNANYMAKRLENDYPILFRGQNNLCAHEFILDCRAFEESANVKVEDIAKRLMDYGFHAPTMSWPVPGTLMIEPTESESKAELDRFCDAMLAIRNEIRAIESSQLDKQDNPLKHAPHTAAAVSSDTWPHKYGREQAAYPTPSQRSHKFWPAVSRIDNPYGDRNLICTCPPMDEIT